MEILESLQKSYEESGEAEVLLYGQLTEHEREHVIQNALKCATAPPTSNLYLWYQIYSARVKLYEVICSLSRSMVEMPTVK